MASKSALAGLNGAMDLGNCRAPSIPAEVPDAGTDGEYSDPLDYSDDDDDLFEPVPPSLSTRLSHAVTAAIEESNLFTIPGSTFAAVQKDITAVLRMAVVDWMMRVVTKVKFHRTTLYNAVYMLDKVLSKSPVKRDDVHLLAATCLWISTKLEETMVPNTSLATFIQICQNKFVSEDFTRREYEICPLMNGRFNYPRPVFFFEPFVEEVGADEDAKLMAQYCLDVSLLAFDFIEVPAPVVTVVAIAAAMGELCPIRRLAMAAQCDANLPYFGEVMRKMEQMSRMVAERRTTALSDIYDCEQIRRFTDKLEDSVGYYSHINEC